jgi:hypothetical protein
MEDSQISVLPPDLAQEAQNLRREWEARNRQLMQERLFGHVSQSSSALSSILRSSGAGMLLHKYSCRIQQLNLFMMFFVMNLKFEVLMVENYILWRVMPCSLQGWRLHIPPKQQCLFGRVCGITSQKTVILYY